MRRRPCRRRAHRIHGACVKKTRHYGRHLLFAPYVVHLLLVGILAVALAACANGSAAPVSPSATVISSNDVTATGTPSAAGSATVIPATIGALPTETVVGTPTPTASPVPPTPSPTPEPETWWTVREATWNETFSVKLDIFGPSIYREQPELRARTRVENVSDEPASFVRWSEDEPAVPIWIALPRPPREPGEPQRVLRLIPLREEGYTPTEYQSYSFPQVVTEVLEPGEAREVEVVWDLTVPATGSAERDRAPDGAYTLRADFFPSDGVGNPGLPDISLEFPISLMRGIRP